MADARTKATYTASALLVEAREIVGEEKERHDHSSQTWAALHRVDEALRRKAVKIIDENKSKADA